MPSSSTTQKTQRVRKVRKCHGYKAGDPPPTGNGGNPFTNSYMAWHRWAAAQVALGVRQKRCPKCLLWNFPQEKCGCDAKK